jgi:hypothetical protein
VLTVLLWVQVLQLWEVMWAYCWKQRHSPEQLAQMPEAAEHKAGDMVISPSKGSPAAADSADSFQDDSTAAATVTPISSTVQRSANGRAVGDSKGDSQVKGSSNGSNMDSSLNTLQQQPHLELFICFVAGVVQSQRRTLLDHCYNADDVLRLFHSARKVDLWQCLDKAHQLLGALHSS